MMMTQGDMLDEQNFQEMDLVPLGPIEHISKRERQNRSTERHHSLERRHRHGSGDRYDNRYKKPRQY